MLEFITHLDKPAAWLVAVVAGLGALGWLGRKTWRGIRAAVRWWREVARPLIKKAAKVVELAEYQLDHNGGGSLIDMAAQIPSLTANMTRLNDQWREHLKQAEGRDRAIAVAKQAQEHLQAGQEQLQASQEQLREAVDEVQVTVTYLAENLPQQDD